MESVTYGGTWWLKKEPPSVDLTPVKDCGWWRQITAAQKTDYGYFIERKWFGIANGPPIVLGWVRVEVDFARDERRITWARL